MLKSRLLFDGGYFAKSLNALGGHDAADYKAVKDKSEFYYRAGRIYDALEKYDSALVNYQNAINTGRNLKYYYAATSALNMGKIYLKRNNKARAKAFFNQAIDMKDHEYENSIETQAKSGLKNTGN